MVGWIRLDVQKCRLYGMVGCMVGCMVAQKCLKVFGWGAEGDGILIIISVPYLLGMRIYVHI